MDHKKRSVPEIKILKDCESFNVSQHCRYSSSLLMCVRRRRRDGICFVGWRRGRYANAFVERLVFDDVKEPKENYEGCKDDSS